MAFKLKIIIQREFAKKKEKNAQDIPTSNHLSNWSCTIKKEKLSIIIIFYRKVIDSINFL